MAFWDLVDLYAGLMSQDIPRLFSEVPGPSRSFPGCIYARASCCPAHDVRAPAVRRVGDQCIAGITMPSRVFTDTVRVGNPERPITRAHYIARHMKVRRNTLHGYDLQDVETIELMAIHHGSLPQRLPEWGRITLLSLLRDPTTLLGRFRRLN